MTSDRPKSRHYLLGQAALSVVLVYGIFAALWILFSDKAVEALFSDPNQIIRISMIKGWLFVAVTTGLLYVLVKGQLAHLNAAHRKEITSLQERQKSLDLLNAIVDNSDDAIFAKDSQGRMLLFNQAACRYAGKTAAEVLGHDDRDLFAPEQAEKLMAFDRQVMTEGSTKTIEENLDTAIGKRTLLATKGPLRDTNAQVFGIFGISRDITERKQAEEALRVNEIRFRALVEQSLAGIYIIQEGYFRYINPGFAAIFGYADPEEIIDKIPVSDLVSPEDSGRVAENIRRRVDGEMDDIHYTFRGLRRDGKSIDVEVHGRVFEYQGKPAVIGLILDVTSRKMAENALRESELRFHDIAKASADWIWEVDAEGRFVYASESVHDLLGYTPAELIGKTPFDLMPPEEAARVRAAFIAVAAERKPFRDLDNTNLHKDGSLRHVQTNGLPVLDAQGNLLGYRGLDRDITERKLAEQELRVRNEELERFNQAMIGRELDMVELKQRINALSKELGRAPPFELAFLDQASDNDKASHGA